MCGYPARLTRGAATHKGSPQSPDRHSHTLGGFTGKLLHTQANQMMSPRARLAAPPQLRALEPTRTKLILTLCDVLSLKW